MSTPENVITSFNETRALKKNEIKKIESQISSLENRTIKKLAKSYLDNNIDLNIEELIKHFPENKVLSLLNLVMEERSLRMAEIDKHLLNLIERKLYYSKDKPTKETKAVYKTFLEVFESLNKELKLKIATFCSGTAGLYHVFPEMFQYLKKEYNLQEYFENKNSIYLDGYNHESFSCNFNIALIKNEKEGLDRIHKTIMDLYNDGYVFNALNIFEYTCSVNGSVSIEFNEETNNPEIYKGRWSDNITFEGSFSEQIEQALLYCSKHYWYESNEPEEDDEY